VSYDGWLRDYYGAELDAVEQRLARGEPLDYAWFRDLDDDLWAILLSHEYGAYPALRAALPALPEPELQETWNGRSGLPLATQSAAFYYKLRALWSRHGRVALADATVLDFGCGWGRLLRLLARDVAPERLFGCDPYAGILGVCARTRVPGRLEQIAYTPSALPFSERFDLVYAFSVFTHLAEDTQLACLRAIHAGLTDDGLLIATIRPAAYVDLLPRTRGARKLRGDKPAYLFVAHDSQPSGDEVTYGEAVLNLPYVRDRWGEWFELLEVSLLLDDMHQVVLTLRRR
jgi:SAM-dependent methyltransferase